MLSTHRRVSIEAATSDPVRASSVKPKKRPCGKKEKESSLCGKERSPGYLHVMSNKGLDGNIKNSEYSKFGVELKPQEVIWRKWSIGVEYSQNLHIKNIGLKILKLYFSSATSTTFRFIFPQPIFISPGTSFCMPITFRPLEKNVHEDQIEFFSEDKKIHFKVPVRAVLTHPEYILPQKLKFGLVGVNDFAEKTFFLENKSLIATSFTWEVSFPFQISPSSGILPAKKKIELKVKFTANEATSYEATSICRFDGYTKIMKLYGISKYGHVSVYNWMNTNENNCTTIVNFENVGVSKSKELFLKLTNYTKVRSFYRIMNRGQRSGAYSPFFYPVTSGKIESQQSFNLPIIFRPTEVGRTSIDYFEVISQGTESTDVVKVIGTCLGPKLELSENLINFKIVPQNISVVQIVKLMNKSQSQALYQFQLPQEEGVFRCEPNSGKIEAFKTIEIKLKFSPTVPINYYRRVCLLVHDSDPIFVDLLGTSHNEIMKPPLLENRHLQRHRIHRNRGLTFLPPSVIEDQLKLKKLVIDEDGCFKIPEVEDTSDSQSFYNNSFDEYFDDFHNTSVTPYPPLASLNKSSLWFGRTIISKDTTPPFKTFQLTNHSKGRISVTWIINSNKTFEVIPQTCNIPARKSSDFRVIFRPKTVNKFYSQEIDCFITYWEMRDYRIICDQFYSLPTHLSIFGVGHTFDERNKTFVPKIKLSETKLNFSPVLTERVSYRTLAIKSKDLLPLLFQFDEQRKSDHFTVKPQIGVMMSSLQLISLRYSPTKVDSNLEQLNLCLNDNPRFNKKIDLFGSMEQASALMSNERELYFRPTHIYTSSTSKYKIQNAGRSPLRFRWVISADDANCISVTPSTGVVRSFEQAEQLWSFRPNQAGKRLFKATLLTWTYNGRSENEDESAYAPSLAKRHKLRIITEGLEGEIKTRENTVDFGSVIAGTSKTDSITLYNESHCDLGFQLSVEQFVNENVETSQKEPLCLELSEWKGTVSAGSKFDILVQANPRRRILYNWSLYCQLLDASDKPINPNSRILLSELSAEGVFPTLNVSDARVVGSGANISKTQLWRWLNLDHLNLCLDSDPQPAEVVYSTATRLSITRRPSLLSDSILDFNFGAAPVGTEDTKMMLVFKNNGLVPLQWNFLLPKDVQINWDYWAESADFSSSELHELYVQDNKLFEIEPTKGTMKPNEIMTIYMRYKHNIPGTHRLPILLKVEQGKEVLINFIGVTVELERRYLHFITTKHTFIPIAVGSRNTLVQLYELFNGGSSAVIYEVGTEALLELQENNFNIPILTCLNPKGEIAPGSTVNLEWIFNPIENRTYSIDVPIHMLGGDTAIITFIGIGFDSRKLQPNMLMKEQCHDFMSLPITQQTPLENQCLQLSQERICFGSLPLHSKKRHLVFMTNKSCDKPVTYMWHASSETVNEVLRVTPVCGTVNPGESVAVKVVFCAKGPPAFYDLDLICQVYDENLQAKYRVELLAWQQECERQKNEFEINDKNIHFYTNKKYKRKEINQIENEVSAGSIKTTNAIEQHVYTTLPTIHDDVIVTKPSSRTQLPRERSLTNWEQPQAPRPFMIHLGVTARSHDVVEFRTYFEAETEKHFLDRNLGTKTLIDEEDKDVSKRLCEEAAKDSLIAILSKLIRYVIDDPTVIKSFIKTSTEDVPLFNAFRTTVPTIHLNKPNIEKEKIIEIKQTEIIDNEVSSARTDIEASDIKEIESFKDSTEIKISAELTSQHKQNEQNAKRREVKIDKKNRLNGGKKNLGKSPKNIMRKEVKQIEEIVSGPQETKEVLTSPPEDVDEDQNKTDQISNEENGMKLHQLPSTKLINELLKSESIDTHEIPDSAIEQTVEENKEAGNLFMDKIKLTSEFGTCIESCFASTIVNILEEALNGEVLLTARPRVVALPPSNNFTNENRLLSTIKSPRVEDVKKKDEKANSSVTYTK